MGTRVDLPGGGYGEWDRDLTPEELAALRADPYAMWRRDTMGPVKRFLTLRWILRAVAALAGTGAAYAPAGGTVQVVSALAAAALTGLSIDLPATREGARHNPAFPKDPYPVDRGGTVPSVVLFILITGFGFMTIAPGSLGCAHMNPPAGGSVAICPSAANLAKRITGTDVLDVDGATLLPPAVADCHETIHQDQAADEGAEKWARAFISETVLRGYLGNRYEAPALAACE